MDTKSVPPWVGHMTALLNQARETDKQLHVFGAQTHKYTLQPPATETAVLEFEKKHGIRLPEEYRDFLLYMGNGGAGPYYGIYGLPALDAEAEDDFYSYQADPVVFPDMSAEDWDLAADPDEKLEDTYPDPFTGILPIGSQGCAYMTGMILHGPLRGRILYYNMDRCQPPFFVRETGFLAWYERWLREVTAGYNIFWFGMNRDGSPGQLMEQYRQAKDQQEKEEILNGYYKFRELPKEQQDWLRQSCSQETDMDIRMHMMKIMAHFHMEGLRQQLETLWELKAWPQALSVIRYKGIREIQEAFLERIWEQFHALQGDAFQDACYIFRTRKDSPQVSAKRLNEAFLRSDLDQTSRRSLLACLEELSDREAVLDHFIVYLAAETDTRLLIEAIHSMHGIRDKRLTAAYIRLLETYRVCENVQEDYRNSQKKTPPGSWPPDVSPEGRLILAAMKYFRLFGMDKPQAWKLLMDEQRWKAWKQDVLKQPAT